MKSFNSLSSGQRRLSVLLVLAALFSCLSAPAVVWAPKAQAFGTINSTTLDQKAEHERITRRALACQPGQSSLEGECFGPQSLDILAGNEGSTGAVGLPDMGDNLNGTAHCDDADYLHTRFPYPVYPQSREEASQALIDCIRYARIHFGHGVTQAGAMVPDARTINSVPGNCFAHDTLASKCKVLTLFGTMLHTAQDFYSHSNYTDRTALGSTVGILNPPGLARAAPATLWNMSKPLPTARDIPLHLTTGCFSLGCGSRITHETLNKDHGDIALPPSTDISNPRTPRGEIMKNFQEAARGAIIETRAQWGYFTEKLISAYGGQRGRSMACVIAHDTPEQCVSDAPAGFGILYKVDGETVYEGGGHWKYDYFSYHNLNVGLQAAWDDVRAAKPDYQDTGVSADIVFYAYDEDPAIVDSAILHVAHPASPNDVTSIYWWHRAKNSTPGAGPVYDPYPGRFWTDTYWTSSCTESIAPIASASDWPGTAPRQMVKTFAMKCVEFPQD